MRFRFSQVLAALAALATVLAVRPAAAEEPSPDPDRTMSVTGRLLDADGKPVANGQVVMVVESWCRTERPLGIYVHNGLPITFRVTGPFRTDGEGRFRATALAGPAQPAWEVFAHVVAAGHGHVTLQIDKWARAQDLTIKLDQEHAIRGRLIDTQGQPVAGATVRPIMVSTMGTTRETLIPTEPIPPYASPLLPAVTTDDKGRFLITGLGKSKVWLEVTHERFATQRFQPQPGLRTDHKDLPFSLVAARVVEGRVTYGPQGNPAARARVVALTGFDNIVQCLTDDDGRYSLNPFPGDSFSLRVFPPDGQPFLVEKKGLTFSQSARLEADVALKKGLLVHGRVTESPSGKPVAGALVLHRPRQVNNPFEKIGFEYHLEWYRDALTAVTSGADGTFQIAVPPGPGHLFVLGPTLDYVHVETSVGELEYGRPSRFRNYPDGLIALDLKPGSKTEDVAVTLRRGVTLRAQVVTPDGKPVAKLMALSRFYLPTGFYNWQTSWNQLQVHDGELALPGCDPVKGGTAWLFDPDHKLGLTLEFTGAEASGPRRTIRLEPCGAATIRAVNGKGELQKRPDLHLFALFSPGTIMGSTVMSDKDDKDLEGDWCFWNNYHQAPQKRDDQGRMTFVDLVPGLPYSLAAFGDFDLRTGQAKMDFRVKSGETLKLPDFVIGK
jgi:protocatechuate 3,4-dioxygenase beta subunit